MKEVPRWKYVPNEGGRILLASHRKKNSRKKVRGEKDPPCNLTCGREGTPLSVNRQQKLRKTLHNKELGGDTSGGV